MLNAVEEPRVPAQPVEHKLAAIFAADIAGYSRLMGLDEIGKTAGPLAMRRFDFIGECARTAQAGPNQSIDCPWGPVQATGTPSNIIKKRPRLGAGDAVLA
jgi:hypothetical protein